MDVRLKFIIIIGLLMWCTPVFADPTTETTPPVTIQALTLSDICSMMGNDGIIFGNMYKNGKTNQDIVNFLENRYEEVPSLAFAIPGIHKILIFINTFRDSSPALYNLPNFPKAMGIMSHDMCMDDNASGWIQELPGKADIIRSSNRGIFI